MSLPGGGGGGGVPTAAAALSRLEVGLGFIGLSMSDAEIRVRFRVLDDAD